MADCDTVCFTCHINQAVAHLTACTNLKIIDEYDKQINRLPDRSFYILVTMDCMQSLQRKALSSRPVKDPCSASHLS